MEVLKFLYTNFDNVLAILIGFIAMLTIFIKTFLPLLKKLANMTETKKDDDFLEFCEVTLLKNSEFLTNAVSIFKEMKTAINEIKDEAKKKQFWESYDKLKEGYKGLTKK